MNKILFFLFLGAVFIFPSCGNFKDVSFSGIENVQGVKLSKDGVEAEIMVKIKNPNNVAFKIYPSSFDATLNGINAGSAHLTKAVRIKANAEAAYAFHIKSDFKNMSLMDLPKLIALATSKHTTISLKGTLKTGRFLIKRNYPINITKTISLNK